MLGLDFFVNIINAIFIELTRSVTGRLFTEDQIRVVTTSTIGKHLADFFPEPADDRAARERVEEARLHIQKASSIIAGMQEELSQQTVQLGKLLDEVQTKKENLLKDIAAWLQPAENNSRQRWRNLYKSLYKKNSSSKQGKEGDGDRLVLLLFGL